MSIEDSKIEKASSSLSKIRTPTTIDVMSGETVIIMLRNVMEKE